MTTENFYISTAINYTNGPPHMGHAYEAICADALARYHRVAGRSVFFCTGTDEHGQKIDESARKLGKTPIELCDMYAGQFQELNKRLSVTNDFFIRTTMDKHKETCKWLFNKSKENGDIYLGTYSGWYNVREEKFVTETEAQASDYKDPLNGVPLTRMDEPSYFFRLGKYKEKLLQHITTTDWIQPEARKQEILDRLKVDLQDLSISRATFKWGIPIPDDPAHVMYVWFDALTNYLSAVGYPNGEKSHFWPADMHLIGKDIVWFHTVIWGAMLMSAGVPLPKCVFSHGFINGPDGKKMSKSLGNVVDPNDMLAKFNVDAFRFYLLKEGTFGSDVNFIENSVGEYYNELCDSLFNLVNRSLNLLKLYCKSQVPEAEPKPIFDVKEVAAKIEDEFKKYNLQGALQLALHSVGEINKFINVHQPWHMKPDQDAERKVVLRSVIEAIYVVAHFLIPFIPDAAAKIFERLRTPAKTIPQLSLGNLTPGAPLDENYQYKKFDVKEVITPIQTVELRVGKVKAVKDHPNNEKQYVLTIDFGAFGERSVVSALKDFYKPDQLQDRTLVVVTNLKSANFKGVASQGMVLTAEHGNTITLLAPPSDAALGSPLAAKGLPPRPVKEIKITVIQKLPWVVAGNQILVDGRAIVAGDKPITVDAPDGAKVK